MKILTLEIMGKSHKIDLSKLSKNNNLTKEQIEIVKLQEKVEKLEKKENKKEGK
jgi:hypothetical protein